MKLNLRKKKILQKICKSIQQINSSKLTKERRIDATSEKAMLHIHDISYANQIFDIESTRLDKSVKTWTRNLRSAQDRCIKKSILGVCSHLSK